MNTRGRIQTLDKEAEIQSDSNKFSIKPRILSTNSITTFLFSLSIPTSLESSSINKIPVFTIGSIAFKVDSITVSKNPSGLAVLIFGKTKKERERERKIGGLINISI